MKINVETLSNERTDFPKMTKQFARGYGNINNYVVSRIGQYMPMPKDDALFVDHIQNSHIEHCKMMVTLSKVANTDGLTEDNVGKILEQTHEEMKSMSINEIVTEAKMLKGFLTNDINDAYRIMSEVISSTLPFIDSPDAQKILGNFFSQKDIEEFKSNPEYFEKEENINLFLKKADDSFKDVLFEKMEKSINLAVLPMPILNKLIEDYDYHLMPNGKTMIMNSNLKKENYSGTAAKIQTDAIKMYKDTKVKSNDKDNDLDGNIQDMTKNNVENASQDVFDLMTEYRTSKGNIQLGKFFSADTKVMVANPREKLGVTHTYGVKSSLFEKMSGHLQFLRQNIKSSIKSGLQKISTTQPDVVLGSSYLSGALDNIRDNIRNRKDQSFNSVRSIFGLQTNLLRNNISSMRKKLGNFVSVVCLLGKEQLNSLQEKALKVNKFYEEGVKTRVFGASMYAKEKLEQHGSKVALFGMGMLAMSLISHVHGFGGLGINHTSLGVAHDIGNNISSDAIHNSLVAPHEFNGLSSQINDELSKTISNQNANLTNIQPLHVTMPHVESIPSHHLVHHEHIQPVVHSSATEELNRQYAHIGHQDSVGQQNIATVKHDGIELTSPTDVKEYEALKKALASNSHNLHTVPVENNVTLGDKIGNGLDNVGHSIKQGTQNIFKDISSLFNEHDNKGYQVANINPQKQYN